MKALHYYIEMILFLFLLLIQLCRIDDIYELLQGQSKSTKAIGQREGLEESGNRRSIFSGFFRKKFN